MFTSTDVLYYTSMRRCDIIKFKLSRDNDELVEVQTPNTFKIPHHNFRYRFL